MLFKNLVEKSLLPKWEIPTVSQLLTNCKLTVNELHGLIWGK